MSDFLYSDKTNNLHDLADTIFNPDTDGIVNCAYKPAVDSKLVQDDLAKYDTLRKYLQACLHHSLNVAPDTITTVHLDEVFGQNIVNLRNYKAPDQKTPFIEIANMLLGSLTQDWLDLSIEQYEQSEQSFSHSQSNYTGCTGVRFIFMPRTPQNHVFYDLRQNTRMVESHRKDYSPHAN